MDILQRVFEEALQWFRELLTSGAETGLETAVRTLNSMPTPTLNEDIFRSLYVRVWGFAVFASLLTGLVGVLLGSFSRQRRGTATQSMFYFLRVYAQGLVLPLAVAIGLMLGNLLTQAALAAAPTSLSADTLLTLDGGVGIGDEILATGFAGLNWVLTWLLAFWVMFLTWGVLPLLVLAVAMSPLALVGKDPRQFMRRSYTWLAVVIAGKVVVTIVLMIGIVFVALIDQIGLAALTQAFQTFFLVLAIWVSWGLHKRFEHSEAIEAWIPAPLDIRLRVNQDMSPAYLESLKSGISSGRQWHATHEAEPARFRQAVAAGAQTIATTSPDPRVKALATVGSVIASRSAARKQQKEVVADD